MVAPKAVPSSSSNSNSIGSEPKLDESERLLGVGRLLVWLMAPVAAEYMKYGALFLHFLSNWKAYLSFFICQGKLFSPIREGSIFSISNIFIFVITMIIIIITDFQPFGKCIIINCDYSHHYSSFSKAI